MAFIDVVGLAGVALVLGAYFLLQAGMIQSDELRFPIINLAGAVLILLSLLYSFNLASFVIEIVWIAISVYGIARILLARRAEKRIDGGDPESANPGL